MSENSLAMLRTICLALPEANETVGGVGSPSFKVREKIFAMQHPMHERPSMWFKALPGLQQVLVESEPEHFFVPPYVGKHGWVGHWLDVEIDWEHVGSLIEDSYRMTAPKRLIAQIGHFNTGSSKEAP